MKRSKPVRRYGARLFDALFNADDRSTASEGPPHMNLVINGQRLWETISETAKFGATADGGVRRLTLSDEDKCVRDWLVAQCQAIGCSITIDDMGNMFARRAGSNPDLAPICMGSHLDTQPTGGKFDGILGVLAALEALRTIHDAGFTTNSPIELVNWTNEEGSRFSPAMLSSGVFAGVFTPQFAYEQTDDQGKTFLQELQRIGYLGIEKVGTRKLGAMFELHIEQGPVLEHEKTMIGAVTGVQGMRWYEVTINGENAHTGATPMHLRKNALLGAAHVIQAIDRIGWKYPPGVATVGYIENKPNSRNVVPGEVRLTVDLRHPDEAALNEMEGDFQASLEASLVPLGLNYAQRCVWNSPAVTFDSDLVSCVRQSSVNLGFSVRDMISGAGHDAAYIARVAPTAMIFVPCRGGISHNAAEFSSMHECAAGAQVLLDSLLAYDRRSTDLY